MTCVFSVQRADEIQPTGAHGHERVEALIGEIGITLYSGSDNVIEREVKLHQALSLPEIAHRDCCLQSCRLVGHGLHRCCAIGTYGVLHDRHLHAFGYARRLTIDDKQ